MNMTQDWLVPELLERIAEGVVVLDRDLRYRFVNAEALRIFGLPAEALLGQRAVDVFPDADRSPFRPAFEEALHANRPTVYRGYDPDRDRWYEQRCYPYSKGITVLFIDVTAQQRTTEALTESEERFQTTADSAPVLIWISDADNRQVYFNRAWTEFTGHAEPVEAGNGWTRGVHPDDCDRLLDRYRQAFEDREPLETEYRLRRHDGAYRWMLVRASPRFKADGTFEGFTGTCTDIHDRWSAERQMTFLAEASRLLSSSLEADDVLRQIAALVVPTLADWAAVDLVPDGRTVERVAIAHVDPDMVAFVEDLNRKYPVDLDAPVGLGEIVRTGKPLFIPDIPTDLIEAGAQDDEHLAILRQLSMTSAISVPLRTRQGVIGALSLVASHGSRRYEAADLRFAEELAARASAAIDNAYLYRQAREAEAALRTLNEALEARVDARTAELARTNHQLAVRNRELQDFAYVASHDLQEPLRKIRSFSSLLTTDCADTLGDEARTYIDRIEESATRMSALIRDLLAFSRVTTEGEGFVEVALGPVLDTVLSDLETRLSETDGRVTVAGDLPTVRADPTQVYQLLLNLVGNGLKFHRPGVAPRVTVSARREAHQTRIAVEDNGIGFDAKYAERIFAPFQRLHARHEHAGTGMGLAIVRRIAERHGGVAVATSTPGEGSRFEVTLPH